MIKKEMIQHEIVKSVIDEICDTDIREGLLIKLPKINISGLEEQTKISLKILNIIDKGEYIGIVVRTTKDFGGRPCFGRASGRSVAIALKRSVYTAIASIEESLNHPKK